MVLLKILIKVHQVLTYVITVTHSFVKKHVVPSDDFYGFTDTILHLMAKTKEYTISI